MEKLEPFIKRETIQREENPFEDEQVSQEWIRSVEGEKGLLRDKEIYPRLKRWTEQASLKVLVEIGAGQGICAEKCEMKSGRYIGVEPSSPLVRRAKELYSDPRRKFMIGNAYDLPIPDNSADAVFSVNVWFHLEDLDRASRELSRILKPDGKFLIITANPDPELTKVWESWYDDVTKERKKLVGKINIPINPLSKNVFYQHTLHEIIEALENNGLKVEEIEPFGKNSDNKDIFIEIRGQKQQGK